MSVSWICGDLFTQVCDSFLCVFAFLLPTHKATCLCHNNSDSHFLSPAGFWRKILVNLKCDLFLCFLTFSPSFTFICIDPIGVNLCASLLCEHNTRYLFSESTQKYARAALKWLVMRKRAIIVH